MGKINNKNFKGVEFDSFLTHAGTNAFVLSPQKWVEKTKAIGIISKSGNKEDKDIITIFEKIGNKKIIKKQNVLYNGQIFDAYVLVNNILKKAKKIITLIDNFVDESVLVLFSEIKDVKKKYTQKTLQTN